MVIKLANNSYGKNAIQLSKIFRNGNVHEFRQITVQVHLKGDFTEAHTIGDNSSILPTDTQKNTVYALAKSNFNGSIEKFALFLSNYFLTQNIKVYETEIYIEEKAWNRIQINGSGHPHAFVSGGSELRFTNVRERRNLSVVESGIKNLLILKTTDSGFENFLKDKYTTLKPTNDRILATECEAKWTYAKPLTGYDQIYTKIRSILLSTFADHKSLSVQHTLYAIGEAVLKQTEELSEITLTMPNIHHIPFNLEQFGLENDQEIFTATSEPYGFITATIAKAAR